MSELHFTIKEDNKVYVIPDMPEEPTDKPQNCACGACRDAQRALYTYKEALQKAKDNAVLVSNTQALPFTWVTTDSTTWFSREYGELKPGVIYSLTGYKVEIKYRLYCLQMNGSGCVEGCKVIPMSHGTMDCKFKDKKGEGIAVISPIEPEETCPFSEMLKNQKDIEPEIKAIVNKHFMDLIEPKENKSDNKEQGYWIGWLKKRITLTESEWGYIRFALSELQDDCTHNANRAIEIAKERDALKEENERLIKELQNSKDQHFKSLVFISDQGVKVGDLESQLVKAKEENEKMKMSLKTIYNLSISISDRILRRQIQDTVIK